MRQAHRKEPPLFDDVLVVLGGAALGCGPFLPWKYGWASCALGSSQVSLPGLWFMGAAGLTISAAGVLAALSSLLGFFRKRRIDVPVALGSALFGGGLSLYYYLTEWGCGTWSEGEPFMYGPWVCFTGAAVILLVQVSNALGFSLDRVRLLKPNLFD